MKYLRLLFVTVFVSCNITTYSQNDDNEVLLIGTDGLVPAVKVGENEYQLINNDEDDDVVDIPAVDPEFPGGIDSLYKFIADNIQYPKDAKNNNISGTVIISFIVEKDGSITDPSILCDIGGGCGTEAIRVVKLMPKWSPGRLRDYTPVRTRFTLPIRFSTN